MLGAPRPRARILSGHAPAQRHPRDLPPAALFIVDWPGRFSGLIYGALSQIAQGFVGVFFFRQRRLEERCASAVAQLLGPGGERAIAGDFVVLDRLGGGDETGIKGGRALVLVLCLIEDALDGSALLPRRSTSLSR